MYLYNAFLSTAHVDITLELLALTVLKLLKLSDKRKI